MVGVRTTVFAGGDMPLAGQAVAPGDAAPDFTVTDQGLQTRTLADFLGTTLIIASVPSLDTGVCDLETRRFNVVARELGDRVRILTISMDLPFAQKRWCGAGDVDHVTVLSDHRQASFGTAWGTLIDDVRLLSRAVFVVDPAGNVVYSQYVPEVGNHPDYDAAVAAARATLG